MKNITAQTELDICEMYKNNIKNDIIIKKYKISTSTLSSIIKKHNIKSKNNRIKLYRTTVTNLNNNLFEKIDNFDSAQILGLIMADGTLNKNRPMIVIDLQNKDKPYLEIIKKKFNSNVDLWYRSSTKSKIKDREIISNGSWSLSITSKKLYNDCIGHNVMPRKTFINPPFPILEENYYNALLLGMYEGDGWISYHTKYPHCGYWGVICTENIKNGFMKTFEQEGICASWYIKPNVNPKWKTYYIKISNQKNLIKLYHFLYKDANFVMKRKHDKWEILLINMRNRGIDVGDIYSFDELGNRIKF